MKCELYWLAEFYGKKSQQKYLLSVAIFIFTDSGKIIQAFPIAMSFELICVLLCPLILAVTDHNGKLQFGPIGRSKIKTDRLISSEWILFQCLAVAVRSGHCGNVLKFPRGQII